MNLKEQLAAKKKEEAEKDEGALPEVVATEEQSIAQDPITPTEAPAEQPAVEEKQPEAYKGPQFRKSSFAYTFKYSRGSIKCDKVGVYTPQNAEEFEILKHAVKAGNILFN